MAIKVKNVEVIDDSNNLSNINSFENTVKSTYGSLRIPTSDITAANRDYIIASTGCNVVQLPSSPNPGNEIVIGIGGSTSTASVPITVSRNGKSIMGTPADLVIDIPSSVITLTYINDALGWVIK